MAAPKALSKITLPEDVVRQDRRKCVKYDQCGLGQKAIYMGSSMSPRKFYIPYEAVSHVFRRVAVSNGAGKGFLAPILYLVVRYDDGKEQQCSFRYVTDADKMLDQLSREHPEIVQLSPEGVKKAALKREREAAIENAVLTDAQEHEVHILNSARRELEKRPSLYENLAATARRKRTQDLIRPGYQTAALLLFIAGAALLVVGILLARYGSAGSVPILLMLVGAALMFMMVNSKVLPTRQHSKKKLDADYEAALSAMERNIAGVVRTRQADSHDKDTRNRQAGSGGKTARNQQADGHDKDNRNRQADSQNSQPGFPLPACYAHPVVIDRMIRIMKEGRAQTANEALEVLKEDLRAADSSVALSGKDYEEVVLIKPLFTVQEYQ